MRDIFTPSGATPALPAGAREATHEEAIERVGRALADATRRRLLLALLSGPAYPAQLAETLHLTRANVSNHLSCLRGCGLVVGTPQGRQVRYELADPRLTHALADLLDAVLTIDPAHQVTA
jgi:DNA-binding transcriptional ArsR family regulator